MSLSYTYEKLYTAMHGLATGAGTVQSRLHSAYLSFHALDANGEVPDVGAT